MYRHLQESADECQFEQPHPTPCFVRCGDYAIPAIQHYLYEHTTEDCMLIKVYSIAQHYSDPTSLSQEAILNQAPRGCQAIFIWYMYEDTIPHYAAWIQATDAQWYACESISYAQFGKIKKLTPADWAALKGTVYCLVKGDPYRHNETLVLPPIQVSQRVQKATKYTWQDGQSLQMFADRQRFISEQLAKDRSEFPNIANGSSSEDEVHITDNPHTTISLQPPHARQIPNGINRADGIWITATVAKVYCEAQQGAHCGAHALHSILNGHVIARSPNYYRPLLLASLQAARNAGVDADHVTTMPHSDTSGWYSVEALNHILHEYVLEQVALVRVMDILPGETYTKHDILQHAPPGCQGLVIQYPHKTNSGT